MKLFSASNPKIQKGVDFGYLTHIMHLAPGRLSGRQVCASASAGCLAGCLNTAGRGHMTPIQEARIRKTNKFFDTRPDFMDQMVKDIRSGIRKADRLGLIPCFRPNGTSDLRWESISVKFAKNIFEVFPNIQFYDYSKHSNRKNIPDNYHLTFSRSEDNDHKLGQALENGMNIAAVFNGDLPDTYMDLEVIDGDIHDLRFLDPSPVIVGLKAKGRAKKDTSGFVLNVLQPTISSAAIA